MDGARQPVLMEAVAQMRSAEPGVAGALHRLHARLRCHGGMIEDGMIEFVRVEYQVRLDARLGFSVTNSGIEFAMPCREFIQYVTDKAGSSRLPSEV